MIICSFFYFFSLTIFSISCLNSHAHTVHITIIILNVSGREIYRADFWKSRSNTCFLTFKLLELVWNRFKTILLNQEMNLKKIPSKKRSFFSDRTLFSKKCRTKKVFFFDFQKFKKINIFDHQHFRKFWFFRKFKNENFQKKSKTNFFSKCFSTRKKCYFSMGFF